MAPDDYEAVATPTASEPEPAPPAEPAPDDDEEKDEEDKDDEEPVEAAAPPVQPLLGWRDYRELAQLTPVQQSMVQTWMGQNNHDAWGHYDRATWDSFRRQAQAYVPTV